MAKAMSTIASIFLLVAADQVAEQLKRKGLLPAEDHPHPEQVASNTAPPIAGPVPFFSETEFAP